MTKGRIAILTGLVILALSIAIVLVAPNKGQGQPKQVTFAECEGLGGDAWRVDLFDPEICPACAEYTACLQANPQAEDLRDACPSTIPCGECMQENFPYPDRCPGDQEVIGKISDAAIWFLCCEQGE